MKRQVSSDWIHQLESREHWISYWYQAKIVTENCGSSDIIIELGPGSGFLSRFLKSKGYKIYTLDIDKDKSPDVVIDAFTFYPRKPIDYFCAFEVLEHLPYEESIKIVSNISSQISKGILISLPIYRKTQIAFSIKLKNFYKHFTIRTPKSKISEPHHHWELGYNNLNEKKIVTDFSDNGFQLTSKMKYLRWQYFYFEKIKQ